MSNEMLPKKDALLSTGAFPTALTLPGWLLHPASIYLAFNFDAHGTFLIYPITCFAGAWMTLLPSARFHLTAL